jgi:uncharacterized protein (DUF488 family)
LVVDVRTVPRSRAHPHFWRERLSAWLPAGGVAYRHEPRLGGLRKPVPDSVNGAWTVSGFRGFADHALGPDFAAALAGLLEEGAARPTAVLCAEALWWRCHRRVITDWVLARGVPVIHIVGPGQAQPGSLTPFARVSALRVTYPDLMSRG